MKWTVEIEVDDSWVADGYEVTPDRLAESVMRDIGYAYPNEVSVKVLKAPAPDKVAKVQGYRDDAHRQALNPTD